MNNFYQDPKIIAAIIAAVTSFLTLIITLATKNFIEKNLLEFKLNAEFKYEQRKKIKNVIALYKSHLLDACDNLNHRLFNFSKSNKYEFLNIEGEFKNIKKYYFHSFVYRILIVYALIHKIQKELIYVDLTIATKEDLEFLKFLKFYNRIFTDTDFFQGCEYNDDKPTDHLYRNMFIELYNILLNEKEEIITFNEYLEQVPNYNNNYLDLFFKLFDGLNPNEDRLRWNWLQILKLLNISFLNTYGYDYQKISNRKIGEAINTPKKTALMDNFKKILKNGKLHKNRQFIKIFRMA